MSVSSCNVSSKMSRCLSTTLGWAGPPGWNPLPRADMPYADMPRADGVLSSCLSRVTTIPAPSSLSDGAAPASGFLTSPRRGDYKGPLIPGPTKPSFTDEETVIREGQSLEPEIQQRLAVHTQCFGSSQPLPRIPAGPGHLLSAPPLHDREPGGRSFLVHGHIPKPQEAHSLASLQALAVGGRRMPCGFLAPSPTSELPSHSTV